MSIEEKAKFIDHVLGFYFEKPFLEAVEVFPSPKGEVESWYKVALVFERVAKAANIPKEQWEILELIVEDATTEYEAAEFIGEAPDTEYELGVGYDGYEIPEGFVAKCQPLIWEAVLDVYSS